MLQINLISFSTCSDCDASLLFMFVFCKRQSMSTKNEIEHLLVFNIIGSLNNFLLRPVSTQTIDEEVKRYMTIHHCVVTGVETTSTRDRVVTRHPHSIITLHSSQLLHHFNLTAYKHAF